MVAFRTVYDSQGHTSNIYYIVIVEQGSGKAFNVTTKKLEEDPDRIDCAIVLNEIGTSGRFLIELPDELPKGHVYDIVIYKQDGSNPQETDDVQDTITTQLGSIFGF